MHPHRTPLRSVSLFVLCSLAIGVAGCGARIDAAEDGQGAKGVVAGDPGDAGDAADHDLADAANAPEASVEPGATFPGQKSALDGGLDHPAPGAFNQLVWSRWWVCDGALCAQQMWINADCTVFWNDRDVRVGQGTMDATNCADLATGAATFDLAGALSAGPPLGGAASAVGGETIEWHTGGPTGPWYRARTELSTAAPISMVRKWVVVGTRSIAGARESDPHLP